MYFCSALLILGIFCIDFLVDDRIQPLVLTIKRWAKARSINDASQGTLSNYSFMLMVIHFLQSKKKCWNRPMYPFVFKLPLSISAGKKKLDLKFFDATLHCFINYSEDPSCTGFFFLIKMLAASLKRDSYTREHFKMILEGLQNTMKILELTIE